MESLQEKLGELERLGKLHFDAIEAIRPEFNHSIQLVERWRGQGFGNFNCVVYALNLQNDRLHTAIACSGRIVRETPSRSGELSIFADNEFLEFCMANGTVLSISNREPRIGDLVIYMQDGMCRHIGKVAANGRIRSKWGTNDLLEHEVDEVPEFYGADVQYMEGLTNEQSRRLFINYTRLLVVDDTRANGRLEQIISKLQ